MNKQMSSRRRKLMAGVAMTVMTVSSLGFVGLSPASAHRAHYRQVLYVNSNGGCTHYQVSYSHGPWMTYYRSGPGCPGGSGGSGH